uniref:histidine kinase n=1 Tax=Desulfovibrio sp. U5L TaxID=596152 RepID=I2PXI9_9BACT
MHPSPPGQSGPASQTPAVGPALDALPTTFCSFQHLAHGPADLAYRTDAADRVEWIAQAGARFLGYEGPEALLGLPAGEALYRQPEDRGPLLAALGTATGTVCLEEVLRRADGTPVTVRTRGVARRDAAGAPAGMEVHSLALSEETGARLTLARALREMETIFDNALVGMVLARNHRIEKINARGVEVLGFPAEELVGRDAAILFPSAAAYQAFLENSRRDLAQAGVHVGEYPLRRKDGRAAIVRSSAKNVCPGNRDEGVIWTFDDVTAQKRLEEELRASKQAAEAASVAKTQFLANMSHELRTPLNGILGMTELLLDTAEDAETRESLGVIRHSASLLMHIVGDLLDLSSVEAGRLLVVEREFDLKAELSPLLRNFATQSLLRAFTFSYHFDPLLPSRLIGDPNRTKQILINLVSNAFKYTKKGTVAVRIGLGDASGGGPVAPARPDRIRLLFSVTDTGIGIDRQSQTAVFEPFGIGENYLTKKYSGAGLGLAIARRLANMLGGDIVLESEPGRGSTFSLTLDCGLPEAVRTAAPVRSATVAESAQPGGLRILLAEDEPVNRIFTVRALQKLGHSVETAADGREALLLLGQSPFDLVLMDIQMPRLNGLEATRMIRSGQVPGIATTIPVVALTAYAMDSDRERGLDAGMDEYVTKPFEPWELVEAMERALAK